MTAPSHAQPLVDAPRWPWPRVARSAALAALLAQALAAQAVPVAVPPADLSGVDAAGGASERVWYGICSTCDRVGSILANQSDGGPGHSTAQVGYTGGTHGIGAFTATASLLADGLPELRVYAEVSHALIGFDAYDHAASASARGVRRFTYTGTEAADYGYTFHISGQMDTLTPYPTAPAAFAHVGLYDIVTTLGGELPYGVALGALAVDALQFSGAGPFSGNLQVSATLQPGQSYYLVASFSASVGEFYGNDASVDGLHTMNGALTLGDAGLLQASAVPEPGLATLCLAGLLLLSLMRRR